VVFDAIENFLVCRTIRKRLERNSEHVLELVVAICRSWLGG
jgi:hypothetical protein